MAGSRILSIQDPNNFWEVEENSSGGARKVTETAITLDSEASTAGIPEGRALLFGGRILKLGSAGVAQDSLGGPGPGQMLAMFKSTQEGLYINRSHGQFHGQGVGAGLSSDRGECPDALHTLAGMEGGC